MELVCFIPSPQPSPTSGEGHANMAGLAPPLPLRGEGMGEGADG